MNVPSPGETSVPKVAQSVRELANGGSNTLGSLELAVSATQTVVSDLRCSPACVPVLVPTSATAGAEAWWIKAIGDKTFTVGHASGGAGRTFRYELRRS